MKKSSYIFIFLCFIPLLIWRDFTPNNELKYLSIADEAIRNGHFFTFWNHNTIYADKPPLYFWIIMLGKWLLGDHYMFFLGLFSLIPALVIVKIMDTWVKPTLLPIYLNSAGITLMTTGLFVGSAIVLRMDMLMCMFITLALYTFYKIYSGVYTKKDPLKLPVFIFLAVFSKGPVGLLVPLISIVSFLIIKKQISKINQYLGWKQWSIFLGLCVIWFTAVYSEGGKSYLYNLLFHQTINRAVDAFDHKAPWWYYLKTISYMLAPWTLFYLITIITGVKKQLINTDLKKFFLTIIVITFITLSLFSAKLDIYLLPIYPFITYLTFTLLPGLNKKFISIGIAIPTLLLTLALPSLWIASSYTSVSIPQTTIFLITTLILTLFSIYTLYNLWQKRLIRATNSLSTGIFLTILSGSLAISGLNQYLGLRKICQKAETIAYENGIKNYYYFQFRSGENIDVYLKQEIHKIDISHLNSLLDKQKFILFVKNKDKIRNSNLNNILMNRKSYIVGNYSIVIF